MYLVGDPPKLQEHLFTPSRSKCLELKEFAEESSLVYFECAKVNAVVKDGKISEQGSFKELLNLKGDFAAFLLELPTKINC